MAFTQREKAPIYVFLTKASDPDVLLRIKAEVEGRVADSDDDSDSESDADDDHGKNAQRRPSKTLKTLIETYHGKCEPRATHHTCLIAFVRESMKALDLGPSQDARDRLGFWLDKLQAIIEAGQNVRSAAVKNAFSDFTALAQHFYRNLQRTRANWHSSLVVWREKIRVSKLVSQSVMSKKAEVLASKLGNKYSENFDRCAAVAMRWKRESEVGDMTRRKAVQLAMACEMSAGMRKTAVYDTSISFHTWQDWAEERQFDEEEGFVFGLDTSKIKAPVERVLSSFGREYIIVQNGTLKSKGEDRFNRYKEDEQSHVEGQSVRKPTLIFTAKEVVAMVAKVRLFFGLTQANRPKGPKARVKLGALVGTRDIRPVMEKDFPGAIAHAKRHGWRVSSHHMRKIYSQSAATIYEHQLFQATGKKIDRLLVVSAWLAHGGSFQTASSYANVEMTFDMRPPAIKSPDAHQLRLVLQELQSLKKQYHAVADEVNNLTVALDERPRVVTRKRKERSIKGVTTQEDRDDRIRDLLWELKQQGVPAKKRRYPKGANRSAYIAYERRMQSEGKELLPEGYVPRKNRSKKRSRVQQEAAEGKYADLMTEEENAEVARELGVGSDSPSANKKPKRQFKHAWVIPPNSENAQRNWVRRAKEQDGRTIENGGLIRSEDCDGKRKTVFLKHGKERIACVEHSE